MPAQLKKAYLSAHAGARRLVNISAHLAVLHPQGLGFPAFPWSEMFHMFSVAWRVTFKGSLKPTQQAVHVGRWYKRGNFSAPGEPVGTAVTKSLTVIPCLTVEMIFESFENRFFQFFRVKLL